MPPQPQMSAAAVPTAPREHKAAATCVACGSGEMRFCRRARAADGSLTGRGSYALLRCASCGTASLAAEAPAGPDLYERGTYGRPGPAVDALLGPLRGLLLRRRMRFLPPPSQAPRVLDVGAGD